MGVLMDTRDRVPIEPSDADMHDLYYKSGSASFQPKFADGMVREGFENLATIFAPIESDGIDDKEE